VSNVSVFRFRNSHRCQGERQCLNPKAKPLSAGTFCAPLQYHPILQPPAPCSAGPDDIIGCSAFFEHLDLGTQPNQNGETPCPTSPSSSSFSPSSSSQNRSYMLTRRAEAGLADRTPVLLSNSFQPEQHAGLSYCELGMLEAQLVPHDKIFLERHPHIRIISMPYWRAWTLHRQHESCGILLFFSIHALKPSTCVFKFPLHSCAFCPNNLYFSLDFCKLVSLA
jgi:hypothetical protein